MSAAAGTRGPGPHPHLRGGGRRGGGDAGIVERKGHFVDMLPVWGTLLANKTGRVPKMAKTEMIRARVEPELKSQAEEVFSRARFVANRSDHAVLSTGNAASRLAFRCEGSQCRDHRSVSGRPAPERDSPNTPAWRISKPGTVDPNAPAYHEAIREGSQAWQKARQGSRQALECRGATSVGSASRPTTAEASVERGLVSLLGMSHRIGLVVGLGPGERPPPVPRSRIAPDRSTGAPDPIA